MNTRRSSLAGSLLLLIGLFSGAPTANADQGSIKIIINGPDADGITNIGICFTNPSELNGSVSYEITGVGSGGFAKHDGTPGCPSYASGSSGLRLAAGTTYNYSATASNGGNNYSASVTYVAPAPDPAIEAARVKRVADDANFRTAQDAAIAAATLESQAWNAANPGKQKCVQWGPIVHSNGVSTASGGVCANPVEPGPGTTVQTVEAPAVEAKTTTPPPIATPVATPVATTNQPDANPTLAVWGSGKPFTRVLPGQLSTDQCPVGFQAANGVIVAIGTGTFTECWPENAWNAWRLGGTTWEDFKNSGGTTNVQAVIDLNAAIASLKSEAKVVAQKAADSTPGIQRCSKWSGYGQSGQECAYTFLAPGEKPLVSESSETPTKPTTDVSSPGTSALPGTDTATVTSSTETPPITSKAESTNAGAVQTTTSGDSNGGLTAISVEGTTQQLNTLIAKVIDPGLEQKSLAKILIKLDALRPITYSKTQSLPVERVIEETAVSLTPDICRVKGTTVTSLKPGKCIFTYELIGASGNSFLTQKSIVFKK
jgi:hypothetical protein